MSDANAPVDATGQALRQLLVPLARLALAQGITHATLDELIKQALVAAADEQLAALAPHRRASRITTATGIHRREVTRLVQELRDGGAAEPQPRSHAAELFARWRSDPAFLDLRGAPRELPRQGPGPSFEALAHTITRDVHPRSLLDELVRLGIAALDAERDTVRLLRETFVPHADRGRMLRTLGANVGSHLQAAVDNVVVDSHRHFEQALFAHGLPADSLPRVKRLIEQQWQQLLDTLVPELQRAVAQAAADVPAADEPAARHRIRLGLYAFDQPEPAPAPAPDAAGRSPRSDA